MSISVVRLGSARAKGEGLRVGTVRRPPRGEANFAFATPRGVVKAKFASENWYDVWLPELSPLEATVKLGQKAQTDAQWSAFAKRYEKEMAAASPSRLLDLLAALSQTASFSVGCYCEDEARCHRSVLRELLRERGAKLA